MTQVSSEREQAKPRKKREGKDTATSNRAQRFQSQAEYRPTPYVGTEWELVGEPLEERNFISMKLEVLKDNRAAADPMFACFDPTEAICSSAGTFQIPGSEPTSIVEIESEAPTIDQEELTRRLVEEFAAGLEQGRKESLAEAEQKIIENYENIQVRMKEITDEIRSQVQDHIGELERRAFAVSIEIARKIIVTTVEVKPDYIIEIIRKAIGSVGAAKPLTVRVSHEDFEFLDVVGLPVDLSESELGVRYLADDSIKSGCVVETDFGELNLEIGSMWEELSNSLKLVLS